MAEDALIRDFTMHLGRLEALHAWLTALARHPEARKLYGLGAVPMLIVGAEYLIQNLTTMREQWRMQ